MISPTVRQLLDAKGHAIFDIPADATVYYALSVMAHENVGALLVFEAGRLAGIFSERDYARKVILQGKSSKDTLVREIMTPVLASIRPGDSVEKCMALMTDQRIRHLPVIEEETLVGVISIGDVVKAVISEQKFVIRQLEQYITGSSVTTN